jgi:hypothetical protein
MVTRPVPLHVFEWPRGPAVLVGSFRGGLESGPAVEVGKRVLMFEN